MSGRTNKLLLVTCDMPSHVYASAKLARVYASAGQDVTLAVPEGVAMQKEQGLLNGVANITCVSAGKTRAGKPISQRPIKDPDSYRTLFQALKNPFPDAEAIAHMMTVMQEGLYEPLRELIRTDDFDAVIPMHSVCPVVCDAVESLDTRARLLIFSSMPYDPATYLPARQTWNLVRSLSTFPHVNTYSATPPGNVLARLGQTFWKLLDTWLTQRAWKRSERQMNKYRDKRGLPPIPLAYLGYLRKYPGVAVGGVPPFLDGKSPLAPRVTVVGTLDDVHDERVPVEGDLNAWLNRDAAGIVYMGFGTGTTLNEEEATQATGELYRALKSAPQAPRIVFALRAAEQKRLRATMDRAFGSSPTSEGDSHLEYENGLFRIQDDVPQASLLDSGQVRVFVSHMGMGGFAEGSQGGVPFVCCPSGCDQYYNTARAIDAGIGLRVRRGFVNLSECVLNALDNPAMQARSKQIAADLHQLDGKKRALEALDNVCAS